MVFWHRKNKEELVFELEGSDGLPVRQKTSWLGLNCLCQGHCSRSNTLATGGLSLAPCHTVSNTGWPSEPKVSIPIVFHFPSGRWRADQLFPSALPLPHYLTNSPVTFCFCQGLRIPSRRNKNSPFVCLSNNFRDKVKGRAQVHHTDAV